MSFAVGERVIHRYHGPGRITRMDHVQSQNGQRECYVVHMDNGLIVWVPIDGTSEQSLRRPFTAEAIASLAKTLSSPAQPLDPVTKQREQQIKTLLKDGSPQALCTLVRDLTAYAANRPLNTHDAAALERARGILLAEWQLATDTPDAAAEIDAFLQKSITNTNEENAL